MRIISISTFICVLLITTQIEDGLADVWKDIGRRLREKASAEGRRFQKNVDEEINNRIRPQLKSWLDRGNDTVDEEIPAADATICVPLVDASVNLACHLDGTTVSCSSPALVGTMADMTCASGYLATHRHGYTRITCLETHAWSNRVIKCLPDCGRENAVGGQPTISNGAVVRVGEFAWHVGIFRLNDVQRYTQICGGSIITPSYILTAAHCFWDLSTKKVNAKELYAVAAGKYHIDWYVDDPHVQRRNLSVLHLHPRFAGDRHFLAYDIALLKLNTDIVLTPLVNTVCVDFDDTLEDKHLIAGKNASIAGWGITELNEPSEVLKSVRLPYIPVENCESIVEARFQKYLTHDKFCAGYLNKATSICPGDSGGGYAFPQETPEGRRFYIRGIASVGHRALTNSGRKCRSEQVAGFTRVSIYKRWIENIVFPPQ